MGAENGFYLILFLFSSTVQSEAVNNTGIKPEGSGCNHTPAAASLLNGGRLCEGFPAQAERNSCNYLQRRTPVGCFMKSNKTDDM